MRKRERKQPESGGSSASIMPEQHSASAGNQSSTPSALNEAGQPHEREPNEPPAVEAGQPHEREPNEPPQPPQPGVMRRAFQQIVVSVSYSFLFTAHIHVVYCDAWRQCCI